MRWGPREDEEMERETEARVTLGKGNGSPRHWPRLHSSLLRGLHELAISGRVGLACVPPPVPSLSLVCVVELLSSTFAVSSSLDWGVSSHLAEPNFKSIYIFLFLFFVSVFCFSFLLHFALLGLSVYNNCMNFVSLLFILRVDWGDVFLIFIFSWFFAF